MPGELVSLVLLPRYTTLAGNVAAFTTVGVDVTPYELAIVTAWRGKLLGTVSPPPDPVRMWFEELTDQTAWSACDGSPDGGDPGENTQHVYTLTFTRRWFRLRIELSASIDLISVWAGGSLARRLP